MGRNRPDGNGAALGQRRRAPVSSGCKTVDRSMTTLYTKDNG
jgi:hypothetical protein